MPDAASPPPLIITRGRVIDPSRGRDQTADLVLAHGKVQKIGHATDADRTGDARIIDAGGRIVCPGLIDPQVHFREPGQEDKETIATGAASAVAGGFTSVVCMANTRPAIDNAALVEYVYTEARKADLANVFPVGAVTKGREGRELAEIGLMHKAGAVAFTDDGDCIASAAVMAKALAYVKMTGKVLMQHCEEPSLVGTPGKSGAMNAGALCTRLGLPGRPAVAEELAILRDVTLNRSIGCRYHVQHLSTGEGLDVIRHAQKQGQPVTTEVAPHHLLLTEEACAGYDTNTRMNPPLRTARDIEALIEGVRDGTITILATDHAPHTPEEKALEFAEAPAGILGLDGALALYAKALIFDHDACDWLKLLGMMTHAPAALCNLQGKGELKEGADADVTIIDPELAWTIDVSQFASKARNCPFDGWQVKGRATHTIVGGAVKWALDN